MVDFWYLRESSNVITDSTFFGEQFLSIPVAGWTSMVITDQDGYELREGIDYTVLDTNIIQTSTWTPEDSKLTGNFTVKTDPSSIWAVHPENQVSIPLIPGNSPTQTILYSSVQNRSNASDFATVNGVTWLSALLITGEKYYWESRVDLGQAQYNAKKMEVNQNLIPGLSIAIGDQVVIGDQCAILVSPHVSEVYEIYGSKENVSFTIEIKANDRLTASEISEMIKGSLLVRERNNMEANGLTIFEITREANYESRDQSGTAPTTTYSMSVSAAADWELYIPLVSRISQFEVDMSDTPQTDYLSKLIMAPRLKILGASQFLPNYS